MKLELQGTITQGQNAGILTHPENSAL